MLRTHYLLLITIFLFACDTGDAMRDKASKNPKMSARVLAADNGCMGCHSVAITIVGPAWQLVAKKYKNQPGAKEFLIEKIKKGGKGNWDKMTKGETMPPYENRMSHDDIVKVVDYILAL